MAPLEHSGGILTIADAHSPCLSAVRRCASGLVSVRLWHPAMVHPQVPDLLIIDLAKNQQASAFYDIAARFRVPTLLALQLPVVDARWVALAWQHPDLTLVRLSGFPESAPAGAWDRALNAWAPLQRMLLPAGAISPTELGRIVLDTEPALRPMAPLVAAICTNPWEVRRPRQLAAACDTLFYGVKRECTRLGFRRVEQVIIAVRAILYEYLVARRHLSPSVAADAAGIGDWYNARRQLARARAHATGPAARILASVALFPRRLRPGLSVPAPAPPSATAPGGVEVKFSRTSSPPT